MKKGTLLVALGLITTLLSITGCKNDENKLALQAGETIFNDKIIYDRSTETPYNVGVKLSLDDGVKVTGVKLGRIEAEKEQFNYKDGVLILGGEFLSKLSTQEKDFVVSLSNDKTVKVPSIIATKVIKTAAEFQAINDNLTGIYVLGNDIDLSSISNFEPLGWYYSETDTSNSYFHGILEGNGYSIKNAKVWYNSTAENNSLVYNGAGLFQNPAHSNGDNIGLFQVIGSSGIVRNVTFDNISVRGRTICGVIAGNVMGTVENCLIRENCIVEGGTHFYDDDCNIGGAFGIVAGSGNVINTVSLTAKVSFPEVFIDNDDTYVGKIGNGWDHTNEPGNTDYTWKYANVDKPLMNYADDGSVNDTGSKAKDSNNSFTNGIYSFAGKTWGSITNCYSISWKQTPYEGSARNVYFSQTHVGANKPGSGSENMGTLTSCSALPAEDLKNPDLYSGYDKNVWSLEQGVYPKLIAPQISYSVISE